MRIAEIIVTHWHLYYNWQGLSYGKLAVLLRTIVIHTRNHRLSGISTWVERHKTVLEKATGWKISDIESTDDRLEIMTGDFGLNVEKNLEFQRLPSQHLIQAFELPTA